MHFFSTFKFFNPGPNPFIKTFKDKQLMKEPKDLFFSDFLKKSVLITGETGVGKTEITTAFVNYLILYDKMKNLFVIDMAPDFFTIGDKRMGGKIADYNKKIDYISKVHYINCEKIIPPRSRYNSTTDVIFAAKKNFNNIHPKLEMVILKLQELSKIKNQMHIGIIFNDLSIYFHEGSFDIIKKILNLQKSLNYLTIFMNAYLGLHLIEDYGSNISNKEKKIVEFTQKEVDISITVK